VKKGITPEFIFASSLWHDTTRMGRNLLENKKSTQKVRFLLLTDSKATEPKESIDVLSGWKKSSHLLCHDSHLLGHAAIKQTKEAIKAEFSCFCGGS
jgi:hypothetical protein